MTENRYHTEQDLLSRESTNHAQAKTPGPGGR